MNKKPLNFKSATAYKKFLGYGHATGIFERTKGNTPIKINGKPHKVSHLNKRHK